MIQEYSKNAILYNLHLYLWPPNTPSIPGLNLELYIWVSSFWREKRKLRAIRCRSYWRCLLFCCSPCGSDRLRLFLVFGVWALGWESVL